MIADAAFWSRPEEARTAALEEMKRLKALLEPWRVVRASHAELAELAALAAGEDDAETLDEVVHELSVLEAAIEKNTLSLALSGPNDPANAYLSVHAGAGGTESCDWAAMLLRMLLRYAERKRWAVQGVDEVSDEQAGVRSATVLVKGSFAYGYLKSEIGVHRLVRISPFDAAKRRHTSFASVDVLPEIPRVEIEIEEKDLRIDTYRAGGKGGQHVNVTDSAVRITHLPTGVVASCQNERSQHQNRTVAMKILAAKLKRLTESKREQAAQKMYDNKGEIAWGNQIRSYVLQPYQMVKDHRTGRETSNVEAVLDGGIEPFVEAYLRSILGEGAGRAAGESGPRRVKGR